MARLRELARRAADAAHRAVDPALRALHRAVDPGIRRLAESRFVSVTIWKPGTFSGQDYRWANFYRVVLPLYDLVIVSIGLRAIRYGVPAFADVTGSQQFGDQWGFILAVSGLSCFLGIVFPKLFPLELWGKIIVFSTLAVYAAAVQILAFDHDGGNRSVVASLAVVAMIVPFWRLGDIATERRLRNAGKQAHA